MGNYCQCHHHAGILAALSNGSLISVALQTSSQNLGMLTAARFLIGFGVQIGQGCAPSPQSWHTLSIVHASLLSTIPLGLSATLSPPGLTLEQSPIFKAPGAGAFPLSFKV